MNSFVRYFILVGLLFMVGCSKGKTNESKGAVTVLNLYNESVEAAAAYGKGAAAYKPANSAIHIAAEKYSDTVYDADNGTPGEDQGVKITASGDNERGKTLLLHVSVPLPWITARNEKFASLDKEVDNLRDCMAKASSNEAANPLANASTCSVTSLTYNGHPGITISDANKSPHMELWIFDPNKTVAVPTSRDGE